MSKASIVISSLSATVVVGALVYWIMAADDDMTPTPAPYKDIQNVNPKAIARQWQWENFTSTTPTAEAAVERVSEEVKESEPNDVVPYDVILIYNMLQNIQLDENGRLVPDQAAKYALERGFDDLGPDVTPAAMSELENLIRIGLPGDAGEQAISIMKTYYEYRRAEEELNQELQELAEGRDSAMQPPSIENYEKLVQLRRRYLGDEIADGLFALEELQARHMFSVIAVQRNGELSEEEKQAQLEAAQNRLNERLLALGALTPDEAAAQEVDRLRQSGASSTEIYAARQALLGPVKAQELAAADHEEAQWKNHFEGFWKERQNIMQAALDEAERERQIENLLGQYFNPEEQERARLTSLQWQSRERQ